MGEERAVENKAANMESRSKHKLKKAKRNEGRTTEVVEEDKNAVMINEFEDTKISKHVDIAEEKRHRKRRDKEKKKNKETKDSESSMEPGAHGKDGNGDAMNVVEIEENKKKKKRERSKNKDDIFERSNAEEVKNDKWLKVKSYKKPRIEKRNRKSMINNQDIENAMEGAKDVEKHAEICHVEVVPRKKRKDRRKDKNDDHGESMMDLITCNDSVTNRTVDNENSRKDLSETLDREKEIFGTKAEKRKKKRGKKESSEDALSTLKQENLPKTCEDNIHSSKHDGKKLERKKRHKKKTKLVENDVAEIHGDELSVNKVKGKQVMLEDDYSESIQDVGIKPATGGMKKRKKLVDDVSDNQTPQKSNKKVRFSGEDEVFPVPIDLNAVEENGDADNLVRGKRFTHEEDQSVKEAVENYIQEHDLGEEGLQMVLNSRKHPELKGCWKEIGSAIPYRPYTAVYYRAQVLFRRSENRKWTQEELDDVLKYQEKYGNQWKQLAEELGKHRWHVKDTWRRIKLADLKKGQWSQHEYQKLFDLVNYDLQLKALEEEKNSKHGMLRDNIPWTAISDKLSTRNQANCCLKWYKQLTSPMVSEGVWADVDDYRLLGALYSLDATCMEDVNWDDLVDNRPGDVCRKRWNQMVLHIGQHRNKSFAERVEVLAQRYCPHLIEAREAWDSKPTVK